MVVRSFSTDIKKQLENPPFHSKALDNKNKNKYNDTNRISVVIHIHTIHTRHNMKGAIKTDKKRSVVTPGSYHHGAKTDRLLTATPKTAFDTFYYSMKVVEHSSEIERSVRP